MVSRCREARKAMPGVWHTEPFRAPGVSLSVEQIQEYLQVEAAMGHLDSSGKFSFNAERARALLTRDGLLQNWGFYQLVQAAVEFGAKSMYCPAEGHHWTVLLHNVKLGGPHCANNAPPGWKRSRHCGEGHSAVKGRPGQDLKGVVQHETMVNSAARNRRRGPGNPGARARERPLRMTP